MIKEIKIFHNDETTPYEELALLIRTVFDARKKEGLFFSCADFSKDDLQKHTSNGYIFVAYDTSGDIIGTVTLSIREKRGCKYGAHEYLAVSNKAKRCGVASKMFQELLNLSKKLELDCITSSTAVKATSSVAYHKKNGFFIYRLESFNNNSYYSYCFIHPLKKFKFLKFFVVRKIMFIISFIVCKATKKENGERRIKL